MPSGNGSDSSSAVSIMRELAHRLELTNNRLLAATTEVQRLRQTAGVAPAE